MVDMERWPNFFIVGASKAGTTSLYEYLRKIPEIYMSPIKEPRYFNSDKFRSYGKGKIAGISDKSKYLQLFKDVKNEKAVGEASPGYLTDPDVPKLIYEVTPGAKILISLRDPVERAFSTYLMRKRNRALETSFNEEIKREFQNGVVGSVINVGLDTGKYSKSITRYLDTFGKNQVKIIIFEEWVKRAKEIIEEILKFLDLEYKLDEFVEEIYNPYLIFRSLTVQQLRHNEKLKPIIQNLTTTSVRSFLRKKFLTKKTTKPEMNKEDRDFLVEFYKDDVKKVETILGRKLVWPNFQN